MTDSNLGRWVTIPNQDLLIDGYLAQPPGTGPFNAIVVFQEIFGVNAHIRDVTERLAQEGYVALAPALYQRQAPGFETGYTPAAIQQGRHYKAGTKTEELLSDLTAAIDYLYQLPQVRKTGVGTIGFCFGGLVAYLAATLPEVRATASFYGAGIPHWSPGDGQATLAYTSQITGTLYAFFGLEDASIPLTDIAQIEQALIQHQVPHRIFRYSGADHGFFCDQRASYEPKVATAAWQEVLQLYRTCLP
ncbi:dienelactone hydrolase family protein [Synechocystis sp. LKSZ1]|uniref:dienelactone hydrolase family protein n=1 Tax=Synechocystis sp. LKSZ1 TaxID=3144951 RepID=UPI00336BF775